MFLSAFLLFVALSGVAAAVDAALLSVSRAEVEEMVVQRRWAAGWLKRAKLDLGRTIVIVVILTNTINVLGPVLVGSLAAKAWGADGLWWATVAMVLGTIVFSEIVPKSLGAHYAPSIARLSSPALVGLVRALYPLVVALDGLSRQLRRPEARPLGTEAQIRSLVVLGRRGEHIESDEARMVHRAFVLNDRTAGDLAKPLVNVVAIQRGTALVDAVEVASQSGFSRFPVFGSSPDDVVGLLLARDVYQAHLLGGGPGTIDPLTRSVPVVPHTRRSDELLELFRDGHVHLAIVRERHHTIGIVTLEDVLEQLVGCIEDEKDVE